MERRQGSVKTLRAYRKLLQKFLGRKIFCSAHPNFRH
ncbi:hypothetical protein M2350_002170 [Candidatus Fervidibacter sacchari]|uniref:Core-binding (CB) domain-containing protein n=1 Tax=Candidatus Fervidibacter sacchari TaxID=1448929 RepID=A0ABT2ES66_9BACT|nr:hypothetical protein [Candidatus Fervidibacter sacchari]